MDHPPQMNRNFCIFTPVPSTHFYPDSADWDDSESLYSDPSEDLVYAANSAPKLAYLAQEAEALLTIWGTCTRPFRLTRHRGCHRPLLHLPSSWTITHRSWALFCLRTSSTSTSALVKHHVNLFRLALITFNSLRHIPRSSSIWKGLPRSCSLSGLRSSLRTFLPRRSIVMKMESGNSFWKPHGFRQGWRSSKQR